MVLWLRIEIDMLQTAELVPKNMWIKRKTKWNMTKIISSLICSCNSRRVDDCVCVFAHCHSPRKVQGYWIDVPECKETICSLRADCRIHWQMKGKRCHNIYCAQTTTTLLLSAAAWCKAHHENIHRASSVLTQRPTWTRKEFFFFFFPPLNTAVRFHETIILYVKVNCGCDSSEWAKQYMVECRVSEWVERKRKIKSYRNSTEKLFPTTTTTVILCAAEWGGLNHFVQCDVNECCCEPVKTKTKFNHRSIGCNIKVNKGFIIPWHTLATTQECRLL